MDVRRFSTEPGWRVGKFPRTTRCNVSFVGEDPFLWLLSFGSAKESDPHAQRAEAFTPREVVQAPLPGLSSRHSRGGGNPATLLLLLKVTRRSPTLQVGFPPTTAVGSLSLDGAKRK